jgi:hypothetical protein
MVYCENCKFIQIDNSGHKSSYECLSKPYIQHNAIRTWKEYKDCLLKNKNNDCKEFERNPIKGN